MDRYQSVQNVSKVKEGKNLAGGASGPDSGWSQNEVKGDSSLMSIKCMRFKRWKYKQSPDTESMRKADIRLAFPTLVLAELLNQLL